MTDRWAGYAPMARHVAPAGARLLDLVRPVDGRVLDLGSGTGATLHHAHSVGIEAIGIDAAFGQLTAASGDLRQACADATALPFPDQTFAGVVSNVALIFVPEPHRAVAEVARVLRPGGAFGFSAWLPDGWPDACRRILADALDRPHVPFPTELGNWLPSAALLRDAGFVDIGQHAGTLRWWFADIDDAVDTLTTAAGGLRLLRTELEPTPAWPSVRRALADEIADRTQPVGDQLVLDDGYLITLGHRPAADPSPTLPTEEAS
ncbi:MAG: class I SAM-dependent methyltransferase [Actinomycetota bacterium]